MKILMVVCLMLVCSGCISGTGFNKKATVMPDEVSLSTDFDPDEGNQVSEVTVGVKWKLN